MKYSKKVYQHTLISAFLVALIACGTGTDCSQDGGNGGNGINNGTAYQCDTFEWANKSVSGWYAADGNAIRLLNDGAEIHAALVDPQIGADNISYLVSSATLTPTKNLRGSTLLPTEVAQIANHICIDAATAPAITTLDFGDAEPTAAEILVLNAAIAHPNIGPVITNLKNFGNTNSYTFTQAFAYGGLDLSNLNFSAIADARGGDLREMFRGIDFTNITLSADSILNITTPNHPAENISYMFMDSVIPPEMKVKMENLAATVNVTGMFDSAKVSILDVANFDKWHIDLQHSRLWSSDLSTVALFRGSMDLSNAQFNYERLGFLLEVISAQTFAIGTSGTNYSTAPSPKTIFNNSTLVTQGPTACQVLFGVRGGTQTNYTADGSQKIYCEDL